MMVWKRLLYLLPGRRRAAERDMQEELRSIAAMAAPGELGNLTLAAEDARAEWGWPRLEQLTQDLLYAARMLRRTPGFTVAAVTSIALGIGANSAIFMLVDRLLLRELPVTDPHQLVFIGDQRSLTGRSARFSYPFYSQLADNTVLDGVAAHFLLPLGATTTDGAARVRGELVSGSYFGVLGVRMRMGRPLTPDDDRSPDSHPVVVISDRFWQRGFGSDPSVVGREIQVNARLFTIVGVAARGFGGVDVGTSTDIWVPMSMQKAVGRDLLKESRTNWLEIIGRLKPGVGPEAAAGALTAHVERHVPFANKPFLLSPAARGNSPRQLEPALKVLFALTGLALVLACFNVASLASVRTVARENEIAVRLSLGSGRARLIRQFVTESAVLAGLSAIAGLLLAPWTANLLIASQPDLVDVEASLDLRLLAFGAAACVLTTALVSLAPILASRKVRSVSASADASMTLKTRSRTTAHYAIVSAQIAISLVMAITAGLFVQSLRNMASLDLGFRTGDMLLIAVDPGSAGYDAPRRWAFWREALDRVSRVAGVESASIGNQVPLAPGRQRQPAEHPLSGERIELDAHYAGPDYFRTLGIPVIRGREFNDTDSAAATPVVIVNERLARTFWPDRDAIGNRVRIGSRQSPMLEVVGVVRDAKYRELGDDAVPMVYIPYFQTRSGDAMTLHLRSAQPPNSLVPAIGQELAHIDPNLPLFSIRTLDDQVRSFFAQLRQAAMLTTGFGLLALLLSGIGVYGVTALAISRQTRELGIRIALGARPADLARMMAARGVALLVIGVTLGLLGAFGFTRVAGALLFGITANDPATLATMPLVLAAVVAIAMFVPVRAAMRLDAATVIRRD